MSPSSHSLYAPRSPEGPPPDRPLYAPRSPDILTSKVDSLDMYVAIRALAVQIAGGEDAWDYLDEDSCDALMARATLELKPK